MNRILDTIGWACLIAVCGVGLFLTMAILLERERCEASRLLANSIVLEPALAPPLEAPAPPLEAPAPPCSGSYVWLTVTGYCPCAKCCGCETGVTRWGYSAYKDGVAGPPDMKLWHVDVPGLDLGPNGNGSWLLIDDTGSSIGEGRLDVRFQSHEAATRFGVRRLRCRVWPVR